MSANFETGHARNIANFNQVISICTRMGAEYQPSNPDLSIARMQLLYTHADAAKMALDQVLPAYSLAVTNREEAFKALPKTVTSVVSYLGSTGASQGVLQDVRAVSRTINWNHGLKKAPAATEGGASTEHNRSSSSHKSYDNQVSNFYMLIQLLKGIPAYQPLEAKITTAGLTNIHDSLLNHNKTVVTLSQPVSSARKRRDSFLYANNIGIVATYRKVKEYVKAVKGKTSAEYKDLAALKFRRPDYIDPNLSFTLESPE